MQFSFKSMLSPLTYFKNYHSQKTLCRHGWVKAIRKHKDVTFIHVSDGRSRLPIQVILKPQQIPNDLTYGCSVRVEGSLQASSSAAQSEDLVATNIEVLGLVEKDIYPFKPRIKHPVDYIRQYPHLRSKTNNFAALLRLRNAAQQCFNTHLQTEGYIQVNTPIITSNDCEGAGEIFEIKPSAKAVSTSQEVKSDFFGVPAHLSVSGQLHLEAIASGISHVYTFGPTFRAEHSRGRHHLSEFYMLEAEVAFIDTQEQLMQIMEKLLHKVTLSLLDNHGEDIAIFHSDFVRDTAAKMATTKFVRMTYSEAISILEENRKSFEFPVKWGHDFHKEHERYLVAHCDHVPVFVTDFPSAIKPFYARLNCDEPETVSAMDLLCSGVGELCGGSLREERLDVQERLLAQRHIDTEQLQWYLDLRRFGTTPHGGFGLGFERYLQTLLGIKNIRDTIPFPRSTGNCKM